MRPDSGSRVSTRRTRVSARQGRRGTDELIILASGLGRSGCAQEDRYYQARLRPLVRRLLAEGRESLLGDALDGADAANPHAYEVLSDAIESEAMGGETGLLIALPVLAWSRYEIPSRKLSPAQCRDLHALVTEGIAAEGCPVILADYLFGPDQLPVGFCGTFELAKQLQDRLARGETVLPIHDRDLPATRHYLADPRYVLAFIQARPSDHALFRWHQAGRSRESFEDAWKNVAQPLFSTFLPNCAAEPLAPDAYFSILRRIDDLGRPFTLRACIAQLQTQYDIPPENVHAILAACYDNAVLAEYRIALLRAGQPQILQGAVWGVLDGEEDASDVPRRILDELAHAGVLSVRVLDKRFGLAECEDCGAPLFPGPDGELTHTETPDEPMPMSRHLH